MKKIIKGKLYDTDTARKIGADSHGGSRSDFGYYEETLYKKRTGEYFLHGEGGPMSRYAASCGDNSWGWGEEIIPLSVQASQKWAEERLSADAYQAEFGPVGEGDGRTVLSISLDAATADRIRKEAQGKGVSVSALIAGKFRV